MPLAHLFQHIDHLAIHQAEITSVERNLDVCDAINHAIEQGGSPQLEPRFTFTLRTHGKYNIIALAPLLCHFEDKFRRIRSEERRVGKECRARWSMEH